MELLMGGKKKQPEISSKCYLVARHKTYSLTNLTSLYRLGNGFFFLSDEIIRVRLVKNQLCNAGGTERRTFFARRIKILRFAIVFCPFDSNVIYYRVRKRRVRNL